MKAGVLVDNLKTGLSSVFHAVSSRSQLPVLLNFLIEAKGGFLYVSATDLEIGIVSKIPANVEKEGRTTVSAKTFFDLTSAIKEEKINLETKDTELLLTGKSLKTSFPTTDPEEFPKIIDEKGKKITDIKPKGAIEDIAKVSFAASLDTSRPALSGVLLKKDEGGVVLVATDGYRLSVKKDFADLNGEMSSILVPARVFKELTGIKTGGEEIEFYLSEKSNQVVFSSKDTTLVGRLIEAEFPDYKKIIPENLDTKAVFDKEEAQDAVRACSIFAREAANIVKLSVGKNKVVFSSSASSVGENTVEIEAKTEGEENEIAFNARYLLDFFGYAGEGEIEFQMTGPLNPGVFKTPSDKNYIHIIMPIRIQG